MREVADLAGVSRSAVSLALQDHPSIPATTRERIHKAAAQLGYRKNPLVAALMRTRRSPAKAAPFQATLAYLTADTPNDAWRSAAVLRSFYASASARAVQRGFRLEEFSLSGPRISPKRLSVLLKTRGIHGIMVAPLPGNQRTLDFELTDFAAVGLGTSIIDPAIDRIADDHFRSLQIAFEQTWALGYRRIGLAVAANVSRRLEHRWLSGFLVAQQSLPARQRVPALMPETREELPPQLNPWIARHRVDAVIFALRNEELMGRAPREVGLVSLSVHGPGEAMAGIRQDEAQIGADATDLLIEKVQRWETGTHRSPRLQLVQGAWSGGLSAPGAGQPRRSFLPQRT